MVLIYYYDGGQTLYKTSFVKVKKKKRVTEVSKPFFSPKTQNKKKSQYMEYSLILGAQKSLKLYPNISQKRKKELKLHDENQLKLIPLK